MYSGALSNAVTGLTALRSAVISEGMPFLYLEF